MVENTEDLQDLKWIAVYDDGEALYEYEDNGTQNRYADIDRKRLSEFHLINDDGKIVLAIALDPGQRLIYRKRRNMDGKTGEIRWTIYMVGWQQTINGKNVQSINWLFPDGSIINTGKFKESSPIFYSVQLLPHEE